MNKKLITLPQANSINIMYKLLLEIPTDLTDSFNVEDASRIIKMSRRQGKYYIDALRYLKLVKKISSYSYILTNEGEQVISEDIPNIKFLNFIYHILKSDEFSFFFNMYMTKELQVFKLLFCQYVMVKYNLKISTAERRFSTILKWSKEINRLLLSFNVDKL